MNVSGFSYLCGLLLGTYTFYGKQVKEEEVLNNHPALPFGRDNDTYLDHRPDGLLSYTFLFFYLKFISSLVFPWYVDLSWLDLSYGPSYL